MAFPTGWSKHKITIDTTSLSLSGALTNYPVCLQDNQFLAAAYSNSQGKQIEDNYLASDANLQGYWKLEDVTDESGNGYDLTNNNSCTFATGKFGNGVDLESGSSQTLSIAGNSCPNLNITGSQTWSCWVKPESNTDCRIMWKDDGSNIRGLYTTGGAGTSELFFYVSGLTTNEYVDSNHVMENAKWHHVCGVYDSSGTKLKVFINGQKMAEVTASGSSTSNAGLFSIGGEAAQYYDGMVDDAAIWNRALTDEEVVAIYTGGADLRFSSDIAGATQIPHEVINWDIDNSEAEVHVKVPSLGTTTTNIYCWYNNSSATPLARDNTYGSDNVWTNYDGVYHLDASFRDSSANAYDATQSATPAITASGKVGNAFDFEVGDNDYAVDATPTNLQITGDVSITCWINVESITANRTVVSMAPAAAGENESENELYSIRVEDSTGDIISYWEGGSGTNEVQTFADANLSTSTWYYLALRRDVSADTLDLRRDATDLTQKSTTTDPSGGTDGNLYIGAIDAVPTQPFDGIIDELRIYDGFLTDDWLKAEYYLQNAPDTYMTATEAFIPKVRFIN